MNEMPGVETCQSISLSKSSIAELCIEYEESLDWIKAYGMQLQIIIQFSFPA
jgi:hypothetical protein